MIINQLTVEQELENFYNDSENDSKNFKLLLKFKKLLHDYQKKEITLNKPEFKKKKVTRVTETLKKNNKPRIF